MKVSFLGASVPLTKHFTATDKTSYPNVYEFTSHTHDVADLQALFDLIVDHAAQGHCLLKGMLQRPLVQESRAGATDRMESTEWLCLDFDGLPPATDINALMDQIPEFAGVDYILQYSASMGVSGQSNLLKAHMFMFLSEPSAPSILKHRLTQLNLSVPELNSSLRLTKTGNALSFVLDPSVAQNDKLIYIAPPICDPDSLDTLKGKRIQLIKRTHPKAKLILSNLNSPEVLKTGIETRINELRAAAGMPAKRKFQYNTDNKTGVTYLAKPDKAIVTGIKREREFVYLNLNGGDSWAYYHKEDSPTFLYNFKDEPVYKISELAPDYYASAKSHADKLKAEQAARDQEAQKPSVSAPTQAGTYIYLVFRDMKSSMYYNGILDTGTNCWTLGRASSERMLTDFMLQHGQPEPEVIPIWNLVFDPTQPAYDPHPAKRTVNLYAPSQVLESAKTVVAKAGQTVPTQVPAAIHKVIWSVVGSHQETYDHFVNWLAYIAQTKRRTQTAWLFSGVHGTGKGTLVHRILRPLFGRENTAFLEANQLTEKFNESLESSMLTCIDEIEVEAFESGKNMVFATLKTWITEPQITIRKMRVAPYLAANHNNFIGFTNSSRPAVIEETDRRYNVGIYQQQALAITDHELDVQIPSELVDFAAYLLTYPVDAAKVRQVLDNDARKNVKELSQTSVDEVANAVLHGDLEKLHSYIVPMKHAQGKLVTIAPLYKDLIYDIFLHSHQVLSREELQIIFAHCVGDVPSSPAKFARYLRHHGITVTPQRRGSHQFRGIRVSWQCDQEWYDNVSDLVRAERVPKKPAAKENQ